MATPDTPADGERLHLALYVRRPVAGSRTVVIDRLGALDADGAIGGFEIRTVPGEVVVPERGADDLSAALATLAEWRGPGIRPTFEVEEDSSRMGRSIRSISLPETIVAPFADRTPACVFPCTDGTRTWTVTDFLDSYETARQTPPGVDVALPTG
ncbi:MAG: HTH domain-containing protein [Salinirussus sp.]